MKKGQVEVVAIVGILIVAVIAVLFSFQAIRPPEEVPALAGEQQVVYETVSGFIREGARSVLDTMARNGGYLSPDDYPMGAVTYNDKPVPYWLLDGRVQFPDFRASFTQGMNNYLRDNIGFLRESLEEQGAEVSEPALTVDVRPDQLTMNVNMPTTVKGSSIPQPYSIRMPTRMSEVFEFGQKLANYQTENRFFEYATLSSMMLSPMEDGKESVPVLIMLHGCGEYAYYDWWSVAPHVRGAIEGTLAQVYMPGKMPLNTAATSSRPKYGLPKFNGKDYANIDASFFLPDDFELDTSNFQMSPDPATAIAIPVPMVHDCFSDVLYVNYYLKYPTVVVLEDPITGHLLRFASTVYIKNNRAGDWTAITGFTPSELQVLCENRMCDADIIVRDTSGVPVPGARVSFMGCPLGQTGSDGNVKGPAPCGAGPLEVTRGMDYALYREQKSTSDENGENQLDGLGVIVERMPLINIHFWKIDIINETLLYNTYTVGDIKELEAGDKLVLGLMSPQSPAQSYTQIYNTRQGKLEFVPPGYYSLKLNLRDKDNNVVGDLFSGLNITEAHEGRTLHAYIPVLFEYDAVPADEQRQRSLTAITLLEECGINGVSEMNPEQIKTLPQGQGIGCIKPASEVTI